MHVIPKISLALLCTEPMRLPYLGHPGISGHLRRCPRRSQLTPWSRTSQLHQWNHLLEANQGSWELMDSTIPETHPNMEKEQIQYLGFSRGYRDSSYWREGIVMKFDHSKYLKMMASYFLNMTAVWELYLLRNEVPPLWVSRPQMTHQSFKSPQSNQELLGYNSQPREHH